MGWSALLNPVGVVYGYWGDEPSDAVGVRAETLFGKEIVEHLKMCGVDWSDETCDQPENCAVVLKGYAETLLTDFTLRNKLDAIYLENWDRGINELELPQVINFVMYTNLEEPNTFPLKGSRKLVVQYLDGVEMDTEENEPWHIRAAVVEDEIRLAVRKEDGSLYTIVIQGAYPILGHLKNNGCCE